MSKFIKRSKVRAVARVSALGLLIGSTVVVSSQTAQAASTLSCDGTTVYGVAQVTGEPPVRALDLAGGNSVQVTAVTGPAIPTNTIAINQAGITSDGGKFITVRNGTIYTYDVAAGTTATAPGQGAAGFNGVGGAVDPTVDLMYLGGFGLVDGAVGVGLSAFDPSTNGPAGGTAGLVARVVLPTSVMPSNGDFAFDLNGNLYVVAGTNVAGGVAGAIYKVEGPLPTAPSSTILNATLVATIPVTPRVSYSGIAVNADGDIVVGGGGREVLVVDPFTGQFGTPRQLSWNQNLTDLASCAWIFG